MYIARLTLNNWLRYRGEQTIELQPKVYGVTARHVDNPDKSNMVGKTSLLEAIEFALFGEHRFPREDGFITHGEASGFVELEMDTGLVIRRERKRGSATQLTVTDGGLLRQVEAQARIIQRLGLDKDDFRNTAYFQQRQIARFILAKPEDRMAIIASWFRLEPLQNAEKNVKAKVRETLDTLKGQQTSIAAKRAYITANLAGVGCSDDECIALQLTGEEEKVRKLDDLIVKRSAGLEEIVEARALWQMYEERKRELAIIKENGIRTKAALDEVNATRAENPRPSDEELSIAKEAVRSARAEHLTIATTFAEATKEAAAKKKLSQGCFSGTCPVNGDECPITDKINAPRKRNLELLDEAKAALDAISSAHNASQSDVTRAERVVDQLEVRINEDTQRSNRIDTLEARVTELRAQYVAAAPKTVQDTAGPPDDSILRADIESLRKALLDANMSIQNLERAKRGIREARVELVTLEQDTEATAKTASVYQEAVQILGRNGAQKRVAEGALADIENGANELLKTCGIDLSLSFQWAREGNGLATDCDSCGAPFPASQKVKRCACGAERGPKMVNKLDIILSDRSGGSEDLAGISAQLAASAWLRNDRGTSFSVALLDEPTGALDEANRRALSVHLANMLKGQYGFEQAFIVSHHKSTTDAMPGRIEIVADSNGSKVRVV
jgi:DNA repair exonuclease SbcCD ATPase subunit